MTVDGRQLAMPEADATDEAPATPPPTSALTGVALKNLDALGWLDDDAIVPPRRQLLTFKDNDKDATFMPLGHTAMLAGAGGMGKSQALMQLAVAVATGTPWLGAYGVASPGPVLVILAEEDAEEYQRRIDECVRGAKLAEQAAWDMLRRNLYPIPMRGKNVEMVTPETVADTQFTSDLQRLLREAGVEWRLVILDPASRFMGADAEIDNASATRWIECLERLTEVPGRPTVLFGHHTNKSALSSSGETTQAVARGSSALTDGVRWQANLEVVKVKKSGEEKTVPHRTNLRLVKSNYTARPDALKLERVTGGYLVPASPDELEAEVAFESGDVKRMKVTEARRQGSVKAAKAELDKFNRENAQAELDVKKANRVARERDRLEKKVKDAESKLVEIASQIAEVSKPACGDARRPAKPSAGLVFDE